MNLHAAAVVRLCPAFVCSMIFLVCPARGEAQAVEYRVQLTHLIAMQ